MNNLQASFKGIEFEVTTHKGEFGHRNAAFSFPFKNIFEIHEFGKKQSTFEINGFLVGKDYIKNRDKLIKCVNDGGVGELIHPYLGRMMVFCQSISVSETHEKQGYCAIDFEFIESSKALPEKPKENKPAIVANDANDVKTGALDAFIEGYSYVKNLVNVASNIIYESQKAIKTAIAAVREVENFLGSVAQIATDFSYLVKNALNFIDRIASLPDFVGKLIDGVCESFHKVLSKDNRKPLAATVSNLVLPGMFASNPVSEEKKQSREEKSSGTIQKLNAYREVYNIKLNKSNNNSNIKEVEKFFQTHVLASACDFAANATFANIKQANSVRDELVSKIDQLMNDPTISDKVFNSLYKLRISTYDALSSIANEIPIIETYENEEHKTLITFCFENFNSIDFFDDIISINNIKSPLVLEEKKEIMVVKNDKVKSQQ